MVKFYGVSGCEYFEVMWRRKGEQSSEQSRCPTRCGSNWPEAAAAAATLGLEAWGGDAVVDGDRFVMIDFNDWPSFSRVRDPAARAIARRRVETPRRPRTAPPYPYDFLSVGVVRERPAAMVQIAKTFATATSLGAIRKYDR